MSNTKVLTFGNTIFSDGLLFRCLIFTIALCAFDALATIQHIDRGVAAEANPVMDMLIQRDRLLFFAAKMAITVAGLMLCYLYHGLRWGRIGIKLSGLAYAVVTLYHAMIIAFSSDAT